MPRKQSAVGHEHVRLMRLSHKHEQETRDDPSLVFCRIYSRREIFMAFPGREYPMEELMKGRQSCVASRVARGTYEE